MEELALKVSFLEKRLNRIEEKLNQIPVPFKLMYKPEYSDTHKDIVDYLNTINKRLEQIENGKTCCDL